MKLIRIGDRIINLETVHFAQHYIYERNSYVLLYFQGANKPLQLKGPNAEALWQHMESQAICTLIEQVSATPAVVEPAIAS